MSLYRYKLSSTLLFLDHTTMLSMEILLKFCSNLFKDIWPVDICENDRWEVQFVEVENEDNEEESVFALVAEYYFYFSS